MSRIAILLLGITLLASSCRQSRKNDLAENIDTYMASLSAQAVKRAGSSYGVTLDYSPDSVKEVEKMLATKYEMQKTHPMAEIEITDAAHLWGASVISISAMGCVFCISYFVASIFSTSLTEIEI